jgi:hypothetical protein
MDMVRVPCRSCCESERLGVGKFDRGWAIMADTDVGFLLDLVMVVAGAFDHAWVGAVTAEGVEVAFGGDTCLDLCQ